MLVRIRPENIGPIKATYMSMRRRMFALWSSFEPRDLEVVIDFITRSTELAVDCCKTLQQEAPPGHARVIGSNTEGRASRAATAGYSPVPSRSPVSAMWRPGSVL